ncbi:MAG: hypothetical protein Q8N55_03535 [bacterium]|nr:hypothetical protein [bacterium]
MPQVKKQKKLKLPDDFKPLMWSYKFDAIDPIKDKERIIINTINYGLWSQWKWLKNFYGKERLKRIIMEIPASEFIGQSLDLILLVLGIQKMKYETRGIKLQKKGLIKELV